MRAFVVAAVLLFPSLASAQTPRIPGAVIVDSAHAEAFRPAWFTTVLCSGRQRSFNAITWFIVPGGAFRDPVQEKKGEQRIRYWGETVFPDTIYVAEVRPEWVVRHELIHYFWQRVDHDDRLNSKCSAPFDPRFSAPPPFLVSRF